MIITPEIDAYTADHSSPEAPRLTALAAETRDFSTSSGMMVGPVEGQVLALMVQLTGASRLLEVGTFTGYSALSMAAALPDGGAIVTCDVNPEHAAVARRAFDASPLADRIDLRLGPALETIAGLSGPFDLVFIDADKVNYINYFEAVLPKLAPGGTILADNVLWSGRVLDQEDQSDDTRAIRAFNDHVRGDPRVTCLMLTIRDGVSVIRPVYDAVGYRAGAVAVVVVHLAFVVFVLVGGYLAWRWRAVLPVHVAAVAISGALAVAGLDCPLTNVERWFRRRAGEPAYRGGFIAHYLVPGGMTPGRRLALRILTVTVVAVAYVRLIVTSRNARRRRSKV